MVSETDLAYLAGLIDGEGSISISRWVHQTRGIRNKNVGHHMHLNLGMTSRIAVEWAAKTFGGNVRWKNPNQADGHVRAIMYYWQVYGTKAVPILRLIFPYLKTKSFQAMLAIAFWNDTVPTPPKLRRRGVSESEMHRREGYYSLMRKCNGNLSRKYASGQRKK